MVSAPGAGPQRLNGLIECSGVQPFCFAPDVWWIFRPQGHEATVTWGIVGALDKAEVQMLCSAGPAARVAGAGPILEDAFMAHPSPARLESLRGFIVDLDGVLWRGGEALPGAAEFIRLLEARSLPYVVATNDPTAKPEELAGWLRELGMPVPPERVLTAGMVVIEALQRKRPRGARVLVIGTDSLKHLVQEAGFRLAEEAAEAVIVTLPEEVRMSELTNAIRALSQGADFLAPNREMVYPSDDGLGAGDGMLVAALEAASGRRARVLGKPRRAFFRAALRMVGLPAAEVLVVGDNLKSDIQAGRRAGCLTALVLTGMTDREQLAASAEKPDWVFEDLSGLARALESERGGTT